MLIPLGHENMRGRRWPVFTIGLIALNVVIFLGTHGKIQEQSPQTALVKVHILMLAATHPEAHMPPGVEQFVNEVQQKNPGLWKEIQSPNRPLEDAWDARMRMMEEPQQAQEEMDSLVAEFEQLEKDSILERYAFSPAHPQAQTYVTANFLHAGWFHIIGNMWFLWLAGSILEDTWGRIFYPIFYFVAGAAALQFHAWASASSIGRTLGASGAVAALMGAFLVRFPNTRIEMFWLIGFFRTYRFKARAYWLLPLWVVTEILYGSLFSQVSGVAHWAHVGGFLFGVVAALGMRYSGLEQHADQAIEAKVGWTADPRIVQATERMEKGQLDEALAELQKFLSEKPNSLDALRLLSQVCWRKSDLPAHRNALMKLCELQFKSQNAEAAWESYQEFLNSGGDKPPAKLWLELCRYLENQQNLDRAVSEYERLAEAYPQEEQSFMALMSAGRLCLKRLNRPPDALRLYQAAKASRIPHLDWDTNIDAGIQEAQTGQAQTASYSPVGSKVP